jgi:hypothetical protein
MRELSGKYYDEKTTKSFELVINKLLKKKYEWFDRIIVNKLSYSKDQDYFGIDAELFADEDWVGDQWREYFYSSKPIPSGTKDDPIILGDIIGGEFSKELQDYFKTVFVIITSQRRPKYMSYNWIDVKPIEMNKKKLTENISRIKSMVISEEEKRSGFIKTSQPLIDSIYRYLELYIKDGYRKVSNNKRSYGNIVERWCIDGSEEIVTTYYFDDEKFEKGIMIIDKNLLSSVQKTFSVRIAFAMYVIEEWYDEVMVPKIEKIMGETGLSIDQIDTMSNSKNPCLPEPQKPEGITDEEMIDFIVKNTLNRRPEVIKTIESGQRNLEDFYLDIVDIVNRKKITGF